MKLINFVSVVYYIHVCRRDKVMMLIRSIDPIGVSERKKHRLVRRKYFSQVS